ncbi:uncharacterized protein LOC134255806 [Saccostrea cucullata]|uniref:uncharacterized protein LOC134255806 n=1 Tax=Saccostrea cuccullata TaxID=36930 RepID=UPI002ED6296E
MLQVFGSLHNLPCRRTVDIYGYDIQCQTNHSIYIVSHVIEDGFQKLSPLDRLFGCDVKNALVCGQHYPINSTISEDSAIFKRAVSTCNGKNMCTLKKKYFEDSENFFRNDCPSLKSYPNAMVRQSIEYECIQENERSVIDMCKYLNVSRNGNVYMKAKGPNKICRCEIQGVVSGLVILSSYKTIITTNQRFRNPPEKKEADIVYGRHLSIRTDRLSITVNLTSLESMIFLKVLIEEKVVPLVRAESMVFITEAPTIDTTKISIEGNYTKTGFLKSLLSTTGSADLSHNVQVSTDFGTDQDNHGWLVTGIILVFLVVTPLFIWKLKPRKNKIKSTETSDNGKIGKI